MMKKLRLISIVFLITSIFFISYTVNTTQAYRMLDTEVHSVTINDAYYIGYDIFTTITITVQTDSNTENYYLQVTLVNPIGVEENIVLHIITSLDTITLDFIFYNYATESGDYTVEATIVSNENGWFAVTDVLVFDPPGGTDGDGDPLVGITVR